MRNKLPNNEIMFKNNIEGLKVSKVRNITVAIVATKQPARRAILRLERKLCFKISVNIAVNIGPGSDQLTKPITIATDNI
jgi:hypothetical protein